MGRDERHRRRGVGRDPDALRYEDGTAIEVLGAVLEVAIEDEKVTPTEFHLIRRLRLFGTTPEFWLNGQRNWDLWHALHSDDVKILDTIEPLAG